MNGGLGLAAALCSCWKKKKHNKTKAKRNLHTRPTPVCQYTKFSPTGKKHVGEVPNMIAELKENRWRNSWSFIKLPTKGSHWKKNIQRNDHMFQSVMLLFCHCKFVNKIESSIWPLVKCVCKRGPARSQRHDSRRFSVMGVCCFTSQLATQRRFRSHQQQRLGQCRVMQVSALKNCYVMQCCDTASDL